MLLLLTAFDVADICGGDFGHQRLGTNRPDDVHRLDPTGKGWRQPAGQQQVGHADSMVGVIVGEEHHVDLREWDVKLVEADRGAAADVDHELLVAGLDQGGGAEPIRLGIGHAATQQSDTESVVGGARGSAATNPNDKLP